MGKILFWSSTSKIEFILFVTLVMLSPPSISTFLAHKKLLNKMSCNIIVDIIATIAIRNADRWKGGNSKSTSFNCETLLNRYFCGGLWELC